MWRLALRILAIPLALATAAAGVLLIAPALYPLGLPHQPLLGGVLIYSGFLIVFVALFKEARFRSEFWEWGVASLVGIAPMFVLAVMEAALAFMAWQNGVYLDMLLAVPAVASVLASIHSPEAPKEAAPPAEDKALGPESGIAASWHRIFAGAFATVPNNLVVTFAFSTVILGIVLFKTLAHSLFADSARTFFDFFWEWRYLFLAFYVGLPLLAFLFAIAVGLLYEIPFAGIRDANRLLTAEELDHLKRWHDALNDYAARHALGAPRRSRHVASVVLYLAGIALLLAIGWYLQSLPPFGVAASDLWIRHDPPNGPVILGLAAIGLTLAYAGLPRAILSWLSRSFAVDYGYFVLTGEPLLYGVKNAPWVRLRTHRLPATIDAEKYFVQTGRHVRLPIIALALALAGFVGVAVCHAREQRNYVDADGFTVTDYWTRSVHHYDFSAVTVEPHCARHSDKSWEASLVYRFPDGRWFQAPEHGFTTSDMDKIERIDGRLANRPVVFDRAQYSTACVLWLDAELGAKGRLVRLLRLSDFR